MPGIQIHNYPTKIYHTFFKTHQQQNYSKKHFFTKSKNIKSPVAVMRWKMMRFFKYLCPFLNGSLLPHESSTNVPKNEINTVQKRLVYVPCCLAMLKKLHFYVSE